MNSTFSSEIDLLELVEQSRAKSYSKLDKKQRSKKGQYGTPDPVAKLMASMFSIKVPEVRLLDAGAGVGSLTAAFLMEACKRKVRPRTIHAVLFEDDHTLSQVLSDNMELCEKFCKERSVLFSYQVISENFIEYIAESHSSLFSENNVDLTFNCAIQNPPYKKIRSDSNHRRLLHRLGIEVSNLYAAFVSLTVRLLEPSGELVAITPRSFCNGPYFKSFRSDFLRRTSLQRIHVFDSRSEAFGGDGVLQENVITHSVAGVDNPETVHITSSSGSPDADEISRFVKYENVVPKGDTVPFIHLITDGDSQLTVERMGHFEATLDALGTEVSTGRVVDFRAKEFLRQMPKNGDVPLIYPMHLRREGIEWPIADSKKPNAIAVERGSETLLVPEGIYVLVKRFSSKEQRRRIEAFVFDSKEVLPSSPMGFENHLNYFHNSGKGLKKSFAGGLACYLNSTLIDQYFRLFSGHTQVNATDLRNLPYPSRNELEHLGSQIDGKVLSQDELDSIFSEKFFNDAEVQRAWIVDSRNTDR
ncbi:MAG: SAM-dependent methyltransferase [Proteobacteria bacterium]|nr:SAM-dependent methyltransferase [Pseudomonadota bacterium]